MMQWWQLDIVHSITPLEYMHRCEQRICVDQRQEAEEERTLRDAL
jgi:hypothetical protein